MNSYCLVLADDHKLFRQGLKMILTEKADTKVIGEADDGAEFLSLLNRLSPNMVILDISMPRVGGIEATGRIKKNNPDIKVLVVTMHRDKEYLRQAFCARADGYLLKEDVDREIFSAIERIRKGGAFISPHLYRFFE